MILGEKSRISSRPNPTWPANSELLGQLLITREAVPFGHVEPLFHVHHLYLAVYAQRVEKIAPEHNRILGRVHSMNPATRQHQSLSLTHLHDLTRRLLQQVPEEHLVLILGPGPPLKHFEILRGGWSEPKVLFAGVYMVPNRGATHVDVKIRVTARDRSQHIFLHLWIVALGDILAFVEGDLAHFWWPGQLDPIQIVDDGWGLHIVIEFGAAELQSDQVEQVGVFLGMFVCVKRLGLCRDEN